MIGAGKTVADIKGYDLVVVGPFKDEQRVRIGKWRKRSSQESPTTNARRVQKRQRIRGIDADIQRQRFVGFDGQVADDIDRNLSCRAAGGDRHRARRRDIVLTGDGRSVLRLPEDVDIAIDRFRHHEIEDQLVGVARIALNDSGIADSQVSSQQHAGLQIVNLRNAPRLTYGR